MPPASYSSWLECAGDPVKRRRLAKKLTLSQKGGVAPVMSDQTGKSEAEFGMVVAWVGLVVGRQRNVRVLPGAPLPRSMVTDRWVWIEQEGRVSVGQR